MKGCNITGVVFLFHTQDTMCDKVHKEQTSQSLFCFYLTSYYSPLLPFQQILESYILSVLIDTLPRPCNEACNALIALSKKTCFFIGSGAMKTIRQACSGFSWRGQTIMYLSKRTKIFYVNIFTLTPSEVVRWSKVKSSKTISHHTSSVVYRSERGKS